MFSVLLGVALFVVLERKVLGIIQLRKGPNKRGALGLTIPLADGVKGVSKELITPIVSDMVLFLAGPCLLFAVRYFGWCLMPISTPLKFSIYRGLFYICSVRVSVFGVLMCGWSRGSQYGVVGAMRGVAQVISYELSYVTVIMCVGLGVSCLELYELRFNNIAGVVLTLEELVLWSVVTLAELNRAPFDFVEGESELVSGYMVEYGGVGFIFIVLSEYGRAVLSGVLSASLFLGSWEFHEACKIAFIIISVVITLVYVLVRGLTPRYRYDMLIASC